MLTKIYLYMRGEAWPDMCYCHSMSRFHTSCRDKVAKPALNTAVIYIAQVHVVAVKYLTSVNMQLASDESM